MEGPADDNDDNEISDEVFVLFFYFLYVHTVNFYRLFSHQLRRHLLLSLYINFK